MKRLVFLSLLLLAGNPIVAQTTDSPVSGDRVFPLPVDESRSMTARWARKEVLASTVLDDMEETGRWNVLEGNARLSWTRENVYEGRQALRQEVSLVDAEHLSKPSQRTPWGSFGGEQGGWTCMALEFDGPQDWSAYNRISIWAYIHPSRNPNVSFALSLVSETPDGTLTPSREMNLDIPQGRWVQVLWEIDALPRDRVLRFELSQTCTGYDRAVGEAQVTIDFDCLELQKVVPDHYEGWDLPSGAFAYAHTGYRPDAPKRALAGLGKAGRFSLIDEKGKTVYRGRAEQMAYRGNSFMRLDFSDFRKPGTYRLRYGGALSEPFPIADDVWEEPLWNAVNFYFCQRCGYPVPGIHDVCHADALGFLGDKTVPVNGGWHDAGDLSQGFWRTAYGCHALLGALDVAPPMLRGRMEEEARWALDWLLKVRFPEGRHMSWSKIRYYSDNLSGTPDDILSPADFVPWECFQGVTVFLEAAEKLPLDDVERVQLETAAREDAEAAFSARDWTSATYLEAAWGAMAASALYRHFGDTAWRTAALHFGDLLLRCQEQEFVDGLPLRGYFYTDTNRRQRLHDHHAAFNEAPLMALRVLSETFPEMTTPCKEAAQLFLDDYLKPGSLQAAPYYLLPAGIFTADETRLQPGTPLTDEQVLRTFPVWIDHIFHGSTNFHLSQAWALAEAIALTGDREALDLLQDQLEWTLGRNPFSSSLMNGVGYNNAPLFVYCTRHTAGALPVGIDCLHDDQPFWNGTASATSHEIWVEPVSRFVGALSVYLELCAAAPVRAQNFDATR